MVALGLCLLELFVSGLLDRDFATALGRAAGTVALASATLLVYSFAILRRPGANTDNLQARSLGLKLGVAAGCLFWIPFLVAQTLATPSVGTIVWLAAPILPLIAGAVGGIGSGKVRNGAVAGFWCGVAGGLLGFMAFATAGNVAIVFRQIGADREIVGAGMFMLLMLYGVIYCPVAGTLGGLTGILLERTDRPSGAWKAHAALGSIAIVALVLLSVLVRK
jgi:hypothetical protein